MRRLVDALLLLMTIIWGTNFPIVKTAFRELNPQAFNAMRMLVASAAFLLVIAVARPIARRRRDRVSRPDDLLSVFYTPTRISGAEWIGLAALGLVGHALYQFCFIGGLARTTVANSSLVLATTPVLITVASAALGHERVSRTHWAGAGVSLLGIYLVVGRGFQLGRAGLIGDLMMFGAVCCWAAYTIGSRPLMQRHSPVAISGVSMALGTLIYVPLVWNDVRVVDWLDVSPLTLFLLVYSALFALCVSYTIWYIGVRQIGSARTAAYSNFIPLVAMTSAVIVLHEPIGVRTLLGALAVLAGVALTRVRAGAAPAQQR